MRTFIKTISLSFIMIAISCSKEVAEPNANQNNNPDRTSYSISIDDLHAYLTEQSTTVLTKGSTFDIQPITSEKDTVLYMVNYEDGWEVFSADKRAPRVFAKAETGSISEADFKEIPALKCLYESFVKNVKYLKNNPEVKPSTDFVDSWDLPGVSKSESNNDEKIRTRSESVVTQPHLLQTKWGQGYPWNIRAPYTDVTLQTHCLTGCGPVAMAQVLFYLQSLVPDELQYTPYEDCIVNKYIPGTSSYITLSSSDITFTPTYNPASVWNSMPLNQYGAGSFAAVSTLMIDIGRITNTEYYAGTSSTYSSYIWLAFNNYFHITSLNISHDFDVLSELIIDNNMPAIMLIGYMGSGPDAPFVGGHYVVADAMKEYRETTNGNTVVTGRYIGFNWGWNGNCDDLWLNSDVVSWTVNGDYYNSISCMIYQVTL